MSQFENGLAIEKIMPRQNPVEPCYILLSASDFILIQLVIERRNFGVFNHPLQPG